MCRLPIRLLFVLTLLCVLPGLAHAETALRAEAENVCRNWLAYLVHEQGDWAGAPEPAIREVEEIRPAGVLLGWNFTIEPAGHVVVPALKEMAPVKLYSDRYALDLSEEQGPAQLLREVLQHRARLYREAYGSLQARQPATGEVLFDRAHRAAWNRLAEEPDAFRATFGTRAHDPLAQGKPLMRTAWHQKSPYNIFCPVGQLGRSCLVGCVATATAQVLKYHAWPPFGSGTHKYYWPVDNSCSNVPAVAGDTLEATYADPYDWAHMLDEYSTSTQTERNAVGELCSEVGIAFNMDYGACGSYSFTHWALSKLPTYFGYSSSIARANRSAHTAGSWFALIQQEISEGRPMLYRMQYSKDGGHAIVCDGWRVWGSHDQYHINYGWGGSYTGWYTIDQMYHTYDINQEYLIYNIMPARTFTVCPNGTGNYTTIQDAIDAAQDGDVIHLCSNTFTGLGNRGIQFHGKKILVTSWDGDPSTTIIDCQGANRAFFFDSSCDENAILQRVTIRNGAADNGGAIECFYSTPTIRGCILENNTATYHGGAIHGYGASPKILSCLFRENQSGMSGGGAGFREEACPTLTNCTFRENHADEYGGAVWFVNESTTPTEDTVPELTDCVLLDNSADLNGGGVYCYRNYSPELLRCTFAGNSALAWGGGMCCWDYCSPELVSCTFHANSAPWGGGGLQLNVQSNATLENTIIAFSRQGDAIFCMNNSNPTLSCCDVYGNFGGDWVGCIASQATLNNNFSADPYFCGASNDNFTIKNFSTCAPAHNVPCGLVGAWPVGCGLTTTLPDNLFNGVALGHAPFNPGYPPGSDWAGLYETDFRVTSPDQQHPVMIGDREIQVWYVLGAWNSAKEVWAAEFGLGDYDEYAFQIVEHGPCFPYGMGTEIPSAGWPAPNTGITLETDPGAPWSGTIVPLYYFAGYVEPGAVTQIPITGNPFGMGVVMFFNMVGVPFDAGCAGALGINQPGLECYPQEEPGEDVRACCLADGNCLIAAETTCLAAGGEWHADWTTCDPNPCPPAQAACCDGETCALLSEEDCTAQGGVWYPDAESCDPNPCQALPDWADHFGGNCVLTVTDCGIVGFMDDTQTEGSGFIYPHVGANLLFVGSLWVGEGETYVANNEYSLDPAREWQVSTDPDGHVWHDEGGAADEVIHASYTDSAAAEPRGLFVDQETWGFTGNTAADDFIIVRYTIGNHSDVDQMGLYVGLFLDLDLPTYTANTGDLDAARNLIYMAGEDELHAGVRVLHDGTRSAPVSNLTLVPNATYVYPLQYMADADKYAFLTAGDPAHVVPTSPEPEDYSVLAAVGPVDLLAGGEQLIAFAIVGGESLTDLEHHADAAQWIYTGGLADVPPEPGAHPLRTRLLPARPNPFAIETRIGFELAHAQPLRLAIYDVSGRCVELLADGLQPAGQHFLPWQGRDAQGLPLPGGVYFLRLETRDQCLGRRLIRIR